MATTARFEGTVTAADMTPWMYDGNGVLSVNTATGPMSVELPARWNLCKAPPVADPNGFRPGQRVRVVARHMDSARVVVCDDPSHRIERLP